MLAAGDFPTGEVARALLFGGGRVVCCDGAAEEFVARGGVPYAVVGDLDSLSPQLRSCLSDRLCHRPDQNHNDLWKALDFVVAEGGRSVIVVGAFGRREDHSIGNLMLLAERSAQLDITMVGDRGVFDFISSVTSFESRCGEQVSLFTLSPSTTITVRGLRYDPPAGHLSALWQGVSNEALGEEFEVVTDGPTIVYRHLSDLCE